MKPSISSSSPSPGRFLLVVVLYEMSFSEAPSIRSLYDLRSQLKRRDIDVLVVDNTPSAEAQAGIIDSWIDCYSFGENRGLAGAYQFAYAKARGSGHHFLILLDQDSTVSEQFISSLEVVQRERRLSIGIWCPDVVSCGKRVSPYSLNLFGWPNYLPTRMGGSLYGINSFSILRVDMLIELGGIDGFYWLDCLDFSLYERAQRSGWRVRRLDVRVSHSLSLVSGETSGFRLRNIAFYEACFVVEFGSIQRIVGTVLRLAVRGIRRVKILRGISGIYHYFSEIIRGLCAGVARRRALLKSGNVEGGRNIGNVNRRPVVSVCMAAYNGERFIAEQINSILPQLEEKDELVVVDDGSSDHTREVVKGLMDTRIRLIEHLQNRGIVETVEEALECANGEILFLSDGDDIWAPDKVQKVIDAFDKNPSAQIVVTGLRLIDEEGKLMDSSDLGKVREFTSAFDFTPALLPNLLRNRFQGSAMALRSTILAKILPLPKRRAFLHDAWIGACNSVTGGQTVYLDEPMLYYRRHSTNFSRRLGFRRQVQARTQLVGALTRRWVSLIGR